MPRRTTVHPTGVRPTAVIVLLLAVSAQTAYAQPPSTTPPATVTRKDKPRDPNCNPTTASAPATVVSAPMAVASAPATVVSAPPATVPAIADTPAPGAVIVPAPTLPATGEMDLRLNGRSGASTEGKGAIGKPCAAEDANAPTEKLRRLAQRHPRVVDTVMRINTTLPGWTLRAGPIVDGGGVAGGAAYRRVFLQDRASFDTMGMASTSAYYLVTAGFTYARRADSPLVFHAALRHESFPEEDFYGFGRHSLQRDHTTYWRQAFDSIGGATFSPTRTFHVTATAGLLNVRMLSGRSDLPSTQDLFASVDVPGLQPGQWVNFLHAGAGIDFDRTDDPIFPKGARYRGSFSRYEWLGGAAGQFSRVDVDIRQFWPMLHTTNQVVAMRALIGAVTGPDAARVPFYFLPRLGGATTLRGYDVSRFTDRAALAFSVEYRVLMMDRVQVLGLADAGDVAPRISALRPTKSHASTGAGLRFLAGGSFLPGADFVYGSEGWAVIFRLGHAF